MAASEKESLLSSNAAASAYNRPTDGDDDEDGEDFDDLGRVYTDEIHHMTWARRVSRKLSKYRWYHPRGHDPPSPKSHRPKLDSAWSYFEHFILPRHFAASEVRECGTVNLTKAEPGETSAETRLYSVWSTPEKDLADMGLGIGIYFFTLRCLAVVMLLAGLINAPNLMYYNSDDYNDDEAGGVPYVLRRSAICTDNYWAACPTCTIEQWNYFPQTFNRYAESADGLRFIKVNTCNFGYFLGLFTLISVIFVSVALYIVCFYVIKRKEVEYDKAEQTAADYSIAVENPPKDADDAEKWKEFFSQFGHVTCLTIGIDNEELVRALVARRKLMIQLHQLLPPGVKFDKFKLESMAEQAEALVWWQKMMGTYDGATILSEINKIDEKILKLSEETYDVTEIFCTFETEEAQRSALKALCVPRIKTLTNSVSGLPNELLYDGKHVLNVEEAPEPTAVRWQDLDDSLIKRIAIRLATSTVTIIFIVCGMLIITHYRYKSGPAMAALAITVLNTIAPYFCYYLTEYESHRTEGGKQASRYFKITAAMWIFTAIVTALITPFTDTVSNSSDSILYSLYAIFIFELIRGPITQCFDISGNVQRHFLGPRVSNRLKLTGLFQGTEYELSERYTSMTNVLFLTFYYATIFPAGYYFCALILAVHYWVDKYCLLRIWAPAPQIGTRVSEMCRGFIMATVLVLAVVSAYYVAGFPFDNACESSKVPSDYVGEFTAVDGDGKELSITIDDNSSSYSYCNMDMERYRPWPAFPAWASNQPAGSEWMDEDQDNISWVFGWTSIVAILLIGLILLRRVVLKFIINMFFGHYMPGGEPSKVGFSDVKKIYAYVCQVRIPGMPLPILACDVKGIERELIGWDDPINGVDAHSVLYDIPEISEKPIFSVIKHWPPPGKS